MALAPSDGEKSIPSLVYDQTSPPLPTPGIYIVERLSGPSSTEVTEGMRAKLIAERVEDCRDEQLELEVDNGTVTVNLDSNLHLWVAEQVSAEDSDLTGEK